jgi:coproporphyrinogen III oxidase-like Fe-S oxidoreductase
LSLYQLTIEPGTAFHTRAAKGEFAVPDEEDAAALFELTQERLAAHGMPAYEISNHARPGAECRHNLAYWRYEDYLGIGPGAHGRVTRSGIKYATRQRRLPEAWLKQPEFEEISPITRETAVEEMVMMGLRLAEGISRARSRRSPECDRGAVRDRPSAAYRWRFRQARRATPRGHRRRPAAAQRRVGALFG